MKGVLEPEGLGGFNPKTYCMCRHSGAGPDSAGSGGQPSAEVALVDRAARTQAVFSYIGSAILMSTGVRDDVTVRSQCWQKHTISICRIFVICCVIGRHVGSYICL